MTAFEQPVAGQNCFIAGSRADNSGIVAHGEPQAGGTAALRHGQGSADASYEIVFTRCSRRLGALPVCPHESTVWRSRSAVASIVPAPQFAADDDSRLTRANRRESYFPCRLACPSGQWNRVPAPVLKTENTGLTPCSYKTRIEAVANHSLRFRFKRWRFEA